MQPRETTASLKFRGEIVSASGGEEMSGQPPQKSKAINVLARLLLTATALAPVGFTYAWVAYIQDEKRTSYILAAVSIGLFLLCVSVIAAAKKSLASSDFRAQSIEAADHENTAFLLLYVMPLFTSNFSTLSWEFWVPTILIFIFITATGYNYHFNPMLGIMGWHFYKVQSTEGVTFVLITKRQIRTNSEPIRVGQFTEYILIDVES